VEANQGTDPCDFFDHQTAVLTILGGNFQSGPPATIPGQLLTLRITNLRGTPAAGLRVTFKVVEGTVAVAADIAGEWKAEETARTDNAGRASLWVRTPLGAGQIGVIHASLESHVPVSAATFVVTALGPQPGWVLASQTVAIAAGGEHTIALQADGTVRAWGRNQAGQLGRGIDPILVPFSLVPLVVPNLSNVIAVAAGSLHSLALQADGTVRAWGEYLEHYQPTPPPGLRGVTAIAAGEGHSLALLEDGTVRAWGDPFTMFAPPPGLSGVIAIAAGRGFSLALRVNGTVAAWGIGPFHVDLGQLQIPAGLNDVQAIAAGGSHSLALRRNGTVTAWGANQFGQSSPPADLSAVVAIAAGESHSLALRSDGTVVLWGNTPLGSAGLIRELHDIRTISAGIGLASFLSVALHSDGTIWSWGQNSFGQLGNNSQLASAIPVRAIGLPDGDSVTNPVPFVVYTPLR
jgi:alpha-tubulin suppressor-like RCC1 family protein